MWTAPSGTPATTPALLQVRYKQSPEKHRQGAAADGLRRVHGRSTPGLCSTLFQAATKSNHFKELHTYYFHNCIYARSCTAHPGCGASDRVETEWLLQNFDGSL